MHGSGEMSSLGRSKFVLQVPWFASFLWCPWSVLRYLVVPVVRLPVGPLECDQATTLLLNNRWHVSIVAVLLHRLFLHRPKKPTGRQRIQCNLSIQYNL